VTLGSTVYFDAIHKGNSKTETTGAVAGVKIVWQTGKSLVSKLEFDSASGPVCAWTSGTFGNASGNLEEYPELYGQDMFIINGKRMFKVSKDKRSQGLSLRCVCDENSTTTGVGNVAVAEVPAASSMTSKVLDNATPSQFKSLSYGLYICKGKKVAVR